MSYFRLVVLSTPLLGHQTSLAGGLVFGVHYRGLPDGAGVVELFAGMAA